MSKSKSILIGFCIGGAISAATVLLSTPSSGKHIRKKIKDQGLEWKEAFNNLTQEAVKLKNQITKTSKEGIALINELTDEMKTSVEEWKTAVEPHQENIHKYLEEIETSLQELEVKIKNEPETPEF
ncbi:MAG TPA: YtxH domain-containing protein [Bacillota bacterium]|nr:YtxH domain-containing protein [Bacillota bacterium]